MQHLDEGTIHAWLDGQLPRGEAAAAEAHVAECRQCADAVAEARGLIAASSRILMALDGVPRDVAPRHVAPDDPSVRAATASGTVPDAAPNAVIDLPARAAATPLARRTRRRWLNGPSLAAAATIVVAVGTFALSRAARKDAMMAAARSDVASSRAGPFVDSSAPGVASAPAAVTPTREMAPLGAGAQSNAEKQAGALSDARALASGAPAEAKAMVRDQSASRDSGAGRTNAFASRVPGAVAANAPAGDVSAKRAARAAEPTAALADETNRLAKARSTVAADSLAERRQFAAGQPAPSPVAQSRADTSTITATRRSDAERIAADRRDVRAEAPAAATTGTIRGRVTDGNNTGLANVVVAVTGTALGVTTNDAGEFTLGGVRPGTYTLTVRRIGFDPVSRDLSVGAGQTTTADVVLRPTPVALNEAVVTASAGQQSRPAVTARGRSTTSPAAPPVAPEAAPGAAVTAGQSSAVGCYDLSITPVSQPTRTTFRQTPRRVALDAEIVPANADGVWYRARDLARTNAVPDGLWRPVGTDGLELEWTYGTLVARIRLTGPPSAVMRGTAQEIDRSKGTGEPGTVVSIRTSCSR